METANLGLPLIDEGDRNKHLAHNEALLKIDGTLGNVVGELGGRVDFFVYEQNKDLSDASKVLTIHVNALNFIVGVEIEVIDAVSAGNSITLADAGGNVLGTLLASQFSAGSKFTPALKLAPPDDSGSLQLVFSGSRTGTIKVSVWGWVFDDSGNPVEPSMAVEK